MVATGTVSSKEAQSKRFASNDGEFRLKIIKIVCYWIYRLRCSVVHHRIGGYILKNEDDDLIVEVGERLTRCMLTSMFQNTKLQGLL